MTLSMVLTVMSTDRCIHTAVLTWPAVSKLCMYISSFIYKELQTISGIKWIIQNTRCILPELEDSVASHNKCQQPVFSCKPLSPRSSPFTLPASKSWYKTLSRRWVVSRSRPPCHQIKYVRIGYASNLNTVCVVSHAARALEVGGPTLCPCPTLICISLTGHREHWENSWWPDKLIGLPVLKMLNGQIKQKTTWNLCFSSPPTLLQWGGENTTQGSPPLTPCRRPNRLTFREEA